MNTTVSNHSDNFSGTESRIMNRTIPRIAGLESPEIPQREAKNESNRSKVESRKIDSESPSESHPNNALKFKATLESHGSNRTILNGPILNSKSPIQPLRR